MSIDATVTKAEYLDDGTAKLHLTARDPKAGPAGQPFLIVLDPPPYLIGLVGSNVWGMGGGQLIFGETKLADFKGTNRIRFTGGEIHLSRHYRG